MIPAALFAFAIVALFMGVMLLVFSPKSDGRRRKGCALEVGGTNACAHCGNMNRVDCGPKK